MNSLIPFFFFLFSGVFNCWYNLGIIQLLKNPSYLKKKIIRKKAFFWPETLSSTIIFPSLLQGKRRNVELQKLLQLWNWEPGQRYREWGRHSRFPSLSWAWVPQQVRSMLFYRNFWFLSFCGKLKRKHYDYASSTYNFT